MIEFKIQKSPSVDILGHYKFYYDSYIIGNHPKSNFHLVDPFLTHQALLLESKEKGLSISSIPSSQYYLSNGKKFSGKKIHQKGETFQIGNTLIEIIDYCISCPSELNMQEIQTQIIKKNHSHNKIIDVLRILNQELLYLEEKLNHEENQQS